MLKVHGNGDAIPPTEAQAPQAHSTAPAPINSSTNASTRRPFWQALGFASPFALEMFLWRLTFFAFVLKTCFFN